MALATLAAIRAGLKAALVAGLGTADQQISAYVLTDPILPTIWIKLKPNSPVDYHQAMGSGGVEIQKLDFLVEVYAGAVGDIAAQQRLDLYVGAGAKSVYTALVADLTLGGVVKTLHVAGCDAYVEFKRADGTFVAGANWTVEVYP